MPTTVILGERHCLLYDNPGEIHAAIYAHIQLAMSRGKALCEFKDVQKLETTWQAVFGVECVSCEDHLVSFVALAGSYSFIERRDVLEALRFTINGFITNHHRLNTWEKILKDDLV